METRSPSGALPEGATPSGPLVGPRLERRGFRGLRPSGALCPHCGRSMSHGLPGNPYMRPYQPCQPEYQADRAKRKASAIAKTPPRHDRTPL
jgi:hypothetical protein